MPDKHDQIYSHNGSQSGVRIDLAVDESPLVLSFTRPLKFNRRIGGRYIRSIIVKKFFERLNDWVRVNGCYVGHIKAFIENDTSNLWITSTGKDVNYKGSTGWEESLDDKYILNLTVIIFGSEKDTLEKVISTYLAESLASL